LQRGAVRKEELALLPREMRAQLQY
jgi:hypothetical protein